MKKILVSCYGFCPDIGDHPGSEFSISWDFINKLSRTNKFQITLLFGSSDGELKGIKNLKGINIENVNIVHVKTNKVLYKIFFLALL